MKILDRLTNKANAYVNTHSKRKLKIGLVVFALIVSAFCFLLTVGIIGNDNASALQIDSISRPKDIRGMAVDSLESWKSKAFDSLKTIIKKLYYEKLH